MSKISLVSFIILWILFQVLDDVNCQLTPFKPSVTHRHTATLIDNKLYILGGMDLNYIPVKDFFYLDVSVPFNTQELSWQDLTNVNMVPPHYSATSVKGGANNNTLFLFGGNTTDQTMALVYTFDPKNIVWSIPKIAGINMNRKSRLTGIIDYNGKLYLWDGTNADGIAINEMLILDTIDPSWKEGSLINTPSPRLNYGATLLPNNKIIYLGGADNVNTTYNAKTLNIDKGFAYTLSEVYIYDTINDSWDTKITSGKIPSDRGAFSTILGLDGQRIIIYGGYFSNPGNLLDTALYVLNLTNYNWYVPNISGKIPSHRAFHKANVIGKYMVVSFGVGYNKSVESDILLLDISNNEEYIWSTTFDPSVPSSPSSPSSSSLSSDSPSSNNIVGAIVGSLFGGIFLLSGILLIYKRKKNNQNQKTNDENNNDGQEEKEIPIERDVYDYENAINNNENIIVQIPNDNHGQEIILTPENENTTNHEPMIVPVNDYHGQEVMQTPKNENTTNHEPIIPASAVVNEQEVISTPNNDGFSLQTFRDEMLKVVKQEIGQNLKNEILQAVREENFNNFKN
ncbi:hypothetical protein RclHR1_02780008 [Rhizophagus clarus]|nr:hypothetical protein RclHR1_02780008 [Rhizophagus clarus]